MQLFAQKLQGIDRARLEAAILPVLRAHGVQTAEVSFQMESTGWVLRLIVESLDDEAALAPPHRLESPVGPAGINLALLAEISRDLSSALDVADFITHRYNLEVSSPGLDRPLRSPRDFQRAVGKIAKVQLARPAEDGQLVLRGQILEAVAGGLRLEVDGKPHEIRLDDVERAHLIFELPAQPKSKRHRPSHHPRH